MYIVRGFLMISAYPVFIQKIATIFQGRFKDHLLGMQFHRLYKKCTFPVYSNKALRLELFASPTSLHFSVHFS